MGQVSVEDEAGVLFTLNVVSLAITAALCFSGHPTTELGAHFIFQEDEEPVFPVVWLMIK